MKGGNNFKSMKPKAMSKQMSKKPVWTTPKEFSGNPGQKQHKPWQKPKQRMVTESGY